jgi:hypothetical protein
MTDNIKTAKEVRAQATQDDNNHGWSKDANGNLQHVDKDGKVDYRRVSSYDISQM